MKKYDWIIAEDGTRYPQEKDLKKKCVLNYLELTNKTRLTGWFDLPELHCDTTVFPDYLALYNQPGLYHKSDRTGVAFFLYDKVFAGQNGLGNAIYYNNKRQLDEFRERFSGVRFFIMPDYSLFGDLDPLENLLRFRTALWISIWMAEELDAVVIPLVTVPSREYLDLVLECFQSCSVVAFSTKGYVGNHEERALLDEVIRETVDRLPLKTIVVYDVCGDNYQAQDIFHYALEKGVELVIPPNSLKDRNTARKGGK